MHAAFPAADPANYYCLMLAKIETTATYRRIGLIRFALHSAFCDVNPGDSARAHWLATRTALIDHFRDCVLSPERYEAVEDQKYTITIV